MNHMKYDVAVHQSASLLSLSITADVHGSAKVCEARTAELLRHLGLHYDVHSETRALRHQFSCRGQYAASCHTA